MMHYTFYISKRKLVCEYVDKYNRLYVLEGNDAIDNLNKISKYNYNQVLIIDDVAYFSANSIKVDIEDYNRILKQYNNQLMFYIIKQNIINKLLNMIKPSKIFIFYLPIIFTSVKLYNITKENDLYANNIEKSCIEELAEPINEYEDIKDLKQGNNELTTEFLSNDYVINIDCYDKGESEDTNFVISKYGDIINTLSNRYGISDNLIIGMITQESHGVHDNLMQVVFNLNDNYISKIYNYENNKYDTIVLTDSPEEYPDVDIIITKEMMKEPYYAILAGIKCFRIDFDQYSKNNICSAICMYNKGYGNWKKVLNNTASARGILIEDILSNPTDVSFISYDDDLTIGDPNYLENVLQYVPNAEEGIYIKTIDVSGNIDKIRICVNKTLGKVNIK